MVFLEKRQISRYNVSISRFLIQIEAKKRKNVSCETFWKGESISEDIRKAWCENGK